jgi:beta-aspartyl-peptidase (threonine type)
VTQAAREEYLKRAQQSAPGTVGAVALDSSGCLAAATSTGGVLLKLPGRVGDSALPGAGNYANRFAAVSATGQGELMIRVLAARRIAEFVETGQSAQQAVEAVLAQMRNSVGSDAGFIALSRQGSIGIAHDTPRMVHAWCSEANPEIQVHAAVEH